MSQRWLFVALLLLALQMLGSALTNKRRVDVLRHAADQSLMAAQQNLELADSLLKIIKTKKYCQSYTPVSWP